MPDLSNDYRVVVFGAGGVGKSSLVLRFVRGAFHDTYIPTVEDTYRQVISSNKQICTLQITDTTGSHQFPAMQRLSILKGQAFVIVYSICSRQSFDEIIPIFQQIKEIKGTEYGLHPAVLVGNKCDNVDRREVDTKVADEMARQWKCGFIETSAKANHNVRKVFEILLERETRRSMSLRVDAGKSKGKIRREKLKNACVVM